MRTAIGIYLAAAAALAAGAAGCKDKPKTQPVQPGLAGSGSGSGAGEPASSNFQKLPPAAGSAAPQSNVLDLPRSSRSAPLKTTKPLAPAQYEKMSALEVPGWKKEIRYLNEKALEVRYQTEAAPNLAVTLVASPCFDCLPPELPKWQAKEAALKNMLPPELRDRPDTVFEIGQTQLAGAPIMFTYQLAHGFGPSEGQNREGPYSNAYTAYHNDGVNQIRVTAQYADAPVATRDELVNLAPKEDLGKIALAFLDAYTHAW